MSKIGKIGALVYLEWEDHSGYVSTGWMETDEIDNVPVIIKTVGFIVKEDDKCISFASCIDMGSGYTKRIGTVLKNCIIKRKVIKL